MKDIIDLTHGQAQHTATPYHYRRFNEVQFVVLSEADKDGKQKLICVVDDEATAAYIVKACNSYDDMLEALEFTVNSFNEINDKTVWQEREPEWWLAFNQAACKAMDAIKKAGEV